MPVAVQQIFNLKGRVAIVTGGAGGLGRQFVRALAEAGADVVVCSRKPENCEQVAGEIRDLGVRALALRCDVADRSEVQEMVDRVITEFGRVDILVNNAGVTWGCPVDKLTPENWERVTRVNVDGVFHCSQLAGEYMIRQRSGKIINLASVAGLLGSPDDVLDSLPYSTSKGAVVNFTRDLAVKWAKYGVNVNAIAPGWFPSRMTRWTLENKGEKIRQLIPLGRFGGEDDLKGAVVFLASDAANYITGQTLVIDGGLSSW